MSPKTGLFSVNRTANLAPWHTFLAWITNNQSHFEIKNFLHFFSALFLLFNLIYWPSCLIGPTSVKIIHPKYYKHFSLFWPHTWKAKLAVFSLSCLIMAKNRQFSNLDVSYLPIDQAKRLKQNGRKSPIHEIIKNFVDT